jgi:hypothetical protein
MATYFASWTAGDDDTGDGSELDPVKTARKLGTLLTSPGDVGRLRGGTYLENLHTTGGDITTMTASGAAPGGGETPDTNSNAITLMAHNGEPAIIDGRNGAGWILAVAGDYWIVKDIEIRNGGSSSLARGGLYFSKSGGPMGCVAQDIHSHHNNETGILFRAYSTDCMVLDCYSHDNYDIGFGGNNADGVKASYSKNFTMKNTVLFRNSDDGLDLIHTGTISDGGGLIENNIALWNGYYDGEFWDSGASRKVASTNGSRYGIKYGGSLSAGSPMYFIRNISFENGFGFVHYAPHTYLYNNLASGNASSGFRGIGQSSLVYRNNIIYNDTVSLVDVGGGFGTEGVYPSDEYNSWSDYVRDESQNNLGVTALAAHFVEDDIPAAVLTDLNHTYTVGGSSPPFVSVADFHTGGFFHLDETYT